MWQVVGHDRAVRLLASSIEAGRVSHAYLLSGPRHVGKSTLAREFAKALNCPQPDRPCGQCRSCKKIEGSIHPDVRTIELEEGSKNISIAAVRDLQDGVALRPFEGRIKVYILEEVERLSEAAANSLLKTLEEPPPSVVLVLTAQDASMLLPTVASRCQHLELHPVPSEIVEGAIRRRPSLDPDRARSIAALAKGRVGWALRAASNPAVLERRGDLLDRMIALPTWDLVARFTYAAELASLHGRDPEAAREALELWQSWWRDLLLWQLGLKEMVVNTDRADRLAAESAGYSVETLSRMISTIQEVRSLLAQNVNARLAAETLMLSVPTTPRSAGS